jgi:hypothetical protein
MMRRLEVKMGLESLSNLENILTSNPQIALKAVSVKGVSSCISPSFTHAGIINQATRNHHVGRSVYREG